MSEINVVMKRGTKADWAASSYVALEGQYLYETDTKRIKIGNGIDVPVDLNYAPMSLEVLEYAMGTETDTVVAGPDILTVRVAYDFHVTEVRSSLVIESSSGPVTIDINESGSSIISTKLSIDATEKTSKTAATAPVISDPILGDDNILSFDVDAAGTGAVGLKVKIYGYRIF